MHTFAVTTATARRLLFAALCLTLAATTSCQKKTPDERIQEIRQDWKDKKVFEAMQKSKEFLKEYPDTEGAFDAMMILASAYSRQNDYEEAHRYLDQIVKKYGAHDERGFQGYLAQLYTTAKEGKTTEAITLAVKSADEFTSPPEQRRDLLITAAKLCEQSGLREKGRKIYQTISNNETDTGTLMFVAQQMMISYTQDKQLAKAGQEFTQLITKFPALDKSPYAEDLRNMMEGLVALLIAEKKYDDAAQTYRDYLKAYPNSDFRPLLMGGIGYLLGKAGHAQEAEKQFAEGIAEVRKKIEGTESANYKGVLTIQLSRMLELKGDSAQAIAVLRAFGEKYTASEVYPSVMSSLVQALAGQKNFDEAIAVAESLKTKFADQPFAQDAEQMISQLRQAQADLATSGTVAGAGMTTGGMTLETSGTAAQAQPTTGGV